ALLGEASLLAFLRSEAGDLLGGMFEPFAVAGGGGGLGLLARQFGFDLSDRRPGVGNGASVELAERIEQGAMAFGVEQAAVIVLAVDLDREAADFAEQAGGDGGGANERAAAAVALQRPADDQRLAGLGLDPLLGEQGCGGMVRRKRDLGRDGGAVLARADQAGVGARAERQAQRTEKG